MNLLYFIFAAGILFMVLLHITVKNIVSVKTVHAGAGNTHTFSDDSTDIRISPFEEFYYNGKKVNPKKYEIRMADGNCMATRGIKHGNLLFIKKFKDGENKADIISKGDILYIKKEKNGRQYYKIREFKQFDSENRAITFSYCENEGIRESSSPHSLNDIEGVVKMNFKYDV